MKITNKARVQFKYTIKSSEGEILSSSEQNGPAVYIHGYKLILPKLEESLEGLKAGEKIKVEIPMSEGFGERQDDLIFEVDAKIFHSDEDLEVGTEFEDQHSGNVVKILELRGEKVLVDANHAFAGKDLVFEIEIEKVELATNKEIEQIQEIQKYAHSCSCGCGENICDGGCCGGGYNENSCGCDCC